MRLQFSREWFELSVTWLLNWQGAGGGVQFACISTLRDYGTCRDTETGTRRHIDGTEDKSGGGGRGGGILQ